MYVLGIHQGHDSNVTLVKDGKIIASVNEERFTRIKHYGGVPYQSIQFCLNSTNIDIKDLNKVVFPTIDTYSQIEVLFDLKKNESYLKTNPEVERKPADYIRMLAVRTLRVLKMWIPLELPIYIKKFPLGSNTVVEHIEHHLAHAAASYYSCGFKEKTLVITADGSGDGLSTTIWIGENGELKSLAKIGRTGSLGIFYGLITEALGWWIGDGEGKTMGLAPYGSTKKTYGVLNKFLPTYKYGKLQKGAYGGLAGVWEDFATFQYHLPQAEEIQKLIKKYGAENIAAEAQRCLEEQLLNLVKHWVEKEKVSSLALGGGVFLNVKANQRIWETLKLKNFFVYPDPADSGLSAGAALYGYFSENKNQFKYNKQITNLYFGPSYSLAQIEDILKKRKIAYEKFNQKEMIKKIAHLLYKNKVVALFNGRMEVGPRALGNRSILMSPLRAENKDIINKTVKYREAFRPFCPSLTDKAAKKYLTNTSPNPSFMIISFSVPNNVRERIPAVVHVDGTVRPQVLKRKDNNFYYDLIEEFGKLTGDPVLLNTSFNIKGQPIVCSPQDAIKCFYDTGIDYLVLENEILLVKEGVS